MSSSVSTTAGNVVVVTHVHPLHQQAEHQLQVGNQKFNKGQPLAVGTVQIMIGLMIVLFGIAMIFNGDSLAVYSGIFVWGALFYITSGSLTVAAGKSAKRSLIISSLVLNIISAIASMTGVIMYSLDTVIWRYNSNQEGFSGVLAVFQFLQLVVSVTAAGFGCYACNCCVGQPPVIVSSVDGSLPPVFQAVPAEIPTQVMTLKTSEPPAAAAMPPPYDS